MNKKVVNQNQNMFHEIRTIFAGPLLSKFTTKIICFQLWPKLINRLLHLRPSFAPVLKPSAWTIHRWSAVRPLHALVNSRKSLKWKILKRIWRRTWLNSQMMTRYWIEIIKIPNTRRGSRKCWTGGRKQYTLSDWTGGGGRGLGLGVVSANLFLVLHIRANRGRAPGEPPPPLNPRLNTFE